MRSVFTTLALTVAVAALSAGESPAQWQTYGNQAYSSGYNYGVQTYSPYGGPNSTYFGYGSQSYYSTPNYTYYPSYYNAPTYNYPLYNHPTHRNAGFPQGYNRRHRW